MYFDGSNCTPCLIHSASKIGVECSFQDVLTVVESGDGGGEQKAGCSKIGPDFPNSATTRGAMDQQRAQADSAHKTGLDSIF
jgi:hypothetical protein